MKKIMMILISAALLVILIGCNSKKDDNNSEDGFKVITTTTMLADLSKIIGGDIVEVNGLMGPGIDPHLYKASAGDVNLMQEADMVVFNGLHLEGKMGEIFENLNKRGKLVVEIAKGLDEDDLLIFAADTELHDPHIWFDVMLWKDAAVVVLDGFKELDPENAEIYENNYDEYMIELDKLDDYIKNRVKEIPEEKRILVTAHDAFEYFGKAYGFEVRGLQGISTASEAGTGDVRDLVEYIVKKEIKAVFVESSVSKKNIEALQEAVIAKGHDLEIGGELYSDSLGTRGTDEETYIGTVKSNIDTIVNALK